MTDRSGRPDQEGDHWQTPEWLYQQLNNEFCFDFDPCPNNPSFDGLSIEWGESNYVNPPYNRFDKPLWIKKTYDEWKKGKTCVMLIPSCTSSIAFHEYILPHAEIRFLKGRIAFVSPGVARNSNATKKGKHDSMIVIFNKSRINNNG